MLGLITGETRQCRQPSNIIL